jgi:hypothetical protein
MDGWVDVETGKRSKKSVPVSCGSMGCEGCRKMRALNVKRYLEGGIDHWLARQDSVVLLSVTEDSQARSFEESSLALRDFTRNLGKWVSRCHPDQFAMPFCFVPELHPGGHGWHWHGLIARVSYPWQKSGKLDPGSAFALAPGRTGPGPVQIRAGDFVSMHDTSGVALSKQKMLRLAGSQGFGLGWAGLRQVKNRGAVGHYLAKYLDKGDTAAALPNGARLVRHSRGNAEFWPGHSIRGLREDARLLSRLEREMS